MMDKAKSIELLDTISSELNREYFICGPEQMIITVSDLLKEKGNEQSNIHFELFTTPVKSAEVNTPTPIASDFSGMSKVKVIIDDEEVEFELSTDGDNILDAAMDAGVDAPFSCKGAVCCTCKGKVIEGSASMEMNYALSDEEVEDGFILTCQAHPTSEKIVIDYDVA
jgi:ring-1,2-phenylacetyl-CoA epoxidase subunit PaaE